MLFLETPFKCRLVSSNLLQVCATTLIFTVHVAWLCACELICMHVHFFRSHTLLLFPYNLSFLSRSFCVCVCLFLCVLAHACDQVYEAVPCHSECSQYEWRTEPWSICTINTVDDLPACGEGVQSRKIRSVNGLSLVTATLALQHTEK